MKTARKALMLILCAALLVSATVMGTLAYLTSQDTVTNTFSVGNVKIDMDETDVDDSTPDKDRDTENKYRLLPGQKYTKDPIITVDPASEDAWVFIQVVNEIANIEADENKVADQIEANGWTELKAGVYYKQVLKTDTDKSLEVFETVTIGEGVDNTTLAAYEGKTVVVTAYAIQVAGFEEDVDGAWDAVYAEYNS